MLASVRPAFYLLAFPAGFMGIVQLVFACLSLAIYRDQQVTTFLIPGSIMLGSALVLYIKARHFDFSQVSARAALLFATASWVVMGFLGAIPIMEVTGVSLADGFFEAISGLTTTGATMLSGLDAMPKSFLMYRQFLQWLGGLGIVIFVVAVLPLLNVGGMRLLKAETPGPVKDEKLAPRVQHTAHYLWYLYLGMTLLCTAGYYFAGMSMEEALAHSFSTISTGGFSTHDASLGYFSNYWIKFNADIFMIVGALAFGVHFKFVSTLDLRAYFRDEEARTFFLIIIVLSLLLFASLQVHVGERPWIDNLQQAFFHLISFLTSTGFVADSYTAWPLQTAWLLVFAGYLGGCSGSTAGGNKIIRIILAIKILRFQIRSLIHPHGVFHVKYNGQTVMSSVLSATMAFLTIAAAFSVLATLALMATGLDFWASLTSVAMCVNNTGPGFGPMGSNFQPASDIATWILSFAMLLGRLEYLTVLVLFTRAFWRY